MFLNAKKQGILNMLSRVYKNTVLNEFKRLQIMSEKETKILKLFQFIFIFI